MALLLAFAFLSGLVTIAAPCIWPLLPIVLSTSSLAGRRRPLGVTLGILLSFGIVTLFISYAVRLLGLDASDLRLAAVAVLVVMGVVLLVPALGAAVESFVSRFTAIGGARQESDGFWPGFLTGLPLGIVWAPCAGPILAAIATLGATRDVGLGIVAVTAFYLAGIGIPLFLFAFAGQGLVRSTRFLGRYTATLQRAFGVVMVVTAAAILFNWDTRIEADLLNAIPSYSSFQERIEGNARVTKELDSLKGTTSLTSAAAQSESGTAGQGADSKAIDPAHVFNVNVRSPEITGINQWLNLPPGQSSLNMEDLRGKVVLLDFWTYTCINCIRTLPHVIGWYNKYHDAGFVVVGVHTPEFSFEHDTGNVRDAIDRLKIPYPVAQDNDYATWKAFGNRYWPAEYLIDRSGTVHRVEFGEGGYDEMETAIRELLAQGGEPVTSAPTSAPDLTPSDNISPETYIGADRMMFYSPDQRLKAGEYADLKPAEKLSPDTFTLGGGWTIDGEFSRSADNATLAYSFEADHVYLVLHAPAGGPGTVGVLLDGVPIGDSAAGGDVHSGKIAVDANRLYEIVDLKDHPGRHLLQLQLSPGIEVYSFTFG